METLWLDPKVNNDAMGIAANLLKAGEVVGMPTETVYGLAANALDGKAVSKIFAAKGRPQDNPLIVHIADFSEVSLLCSALPQKAKLLADAFWPGPLTMILPKSEKIPDEVSAGLDTVGIRLPSHRVARALIRAAGVPLAAPSANLSGRPSTTTAEHVKSDMNGKIAAIIDGGECTVGVESTVISLAGDTPRLLRPGGITLEQLRSVLGTVEIDHALYETIGADEKVSSPGMKYRHYAPKAAVTVVCGAPEKTAEYILKNAKKEDGILCFDEFAKIFTNATVLSYGGMHDLEKQAKTIFDKLRTFDAYDVPQIFAQCPDESGIGLAVSNRLKKAAGFRLISVK